MQPLKYIITGGPGMGKTSLVESLRNEGFPVFEEIARQVIREQLDLDTTNVPWLDLAAFSDLVFYRMQELHADTEQFPVSFFDRGIPDIIGYLRWKDLPTPDFYLPAIENYGYAKQVFIAGPWPDIYGTDDERKESFEDAVVLYDSLKSVYTDFGFEVIELPKGTVDERKAFVLETVQTLSPLTS